MMKNKFYYLAFILIIQTGFAIAQDAQIEIPAFKDKYSDYVKQLESGNINIDYVDFRNSFLDSKQFTEKKKL